MDFGRKVNQKGASPVEIKSWEGNVLFALGTAKTITELLVAAVKARTDLYGANLYGANLYGADLYGANLRGAENADLVIAQTQFIPTEGGFIGWKKCRDGAIVKLGISSRAKRSHGSERKARCSRAKVLAIWDSQGKAISEAVSQFDRTFVYRVGEIVEPKNGWDEDRWNTCGAGIHFYITREEAKAHA
jgi:hypothetical protein